MSQGTQTLSEKVPLSNVSSPFLHWYPPNSTSVGLVECKLFLALEVGMSATSFLNSHFPSGDALVCPCPESPSSLSALLPCQVVNWLWCPLCLQVYLPCHFLLLQHDPGSRSTLFFATEGWLWPQTSQGSPSLSPLFVAGWVCENDDKSGICVTLRGQPLYCPFSTMKSLIEAIMWCTGSKQHQPCLL